MEDLCARCRQYVYYDLTARTDDQLADAELTEIATQHDDWDDPTLNRNKEGLGFLDDVD